MKDVVGRTIGVLDESGAVIACSDLSRIGEQTDPRAGEASVSNVGIVWNGYTYVSFGTAMQPEFSVFVEGADALAEKYAGMLSVSLSSIKQFYDEKYDRGNFIKNLSTLPWNV